MKHTNIQFEVSSTSMAERICAICANHYQSAKVSSIGYIGGYFHSAPAIITCTYEDDEQGKMAWSNTLSELIRRGYHNCIY